MRRHFLSLSARSLCLFFGFFITFHQIGTSKRLCGQMLTRELKRVCTKQGMKGPCLHGAANFAPVQKKRGGDSFFPVPEIRKPLAKRFSAVPTLAPLFVLDNNSAALGQPFSSWPSKRRNGGKFLQNFYSMKRRNGENRRGLIGQQRLKRARGIVDKCCSAEGCDDAFLDSFCCDETEEKAFRANHKI
ncbi:hypothetical protein niasHT_024282 [Heterodera trifolii]|uniref:Insulin-like domain-containing protein n=1 Tax=Heterodera trifolii TaxID=157864 RepID=A0ABD2JM42_9BILA